MVTTGYHNGIGAVGVDVRPPQQERCKLINRETIAGLCLLGLVVPGCGDLIVGNNNPDVGLDTTVDTADTAETGECSSDANCTDRPTSCFSGACVSGTCEYTALADTCFIDDACFQTGQEEPGDRCKVCNPALTTEGFVNKACAAGEVCDAPTGECIDANKVGPGEPCVSVDDCLNDAPCVPTPDGSVCSAGCTLDGDCPTGLTCGPDGACVDATVNLCRPCNLDSECAGLGVLGARCVQFSGGAGSFCGTACGAGGACPTGYSCLDSDGAGEQCVPDSGACDCSALAVSQGASTACGVGLCNGTATCEAGGLSECVGSEPVAEVCDGVDNNCDGRVDEVWLDAQGRLVSDENCGACGTSCVGAIANGTSSCIVTDEVPGCGLTACDAGFEELTSGVCTPLSEVGCALCDSTSDCIGNLTCEMVGTATYCVEACTVGGDECGAGFECTDVDDAGTLLCVLATGGCSAAGTGCEASTECEDLDPCTTNACVENVCAFEVMDCSGLDSACGSGVCADGACVVEPSLDGGTCDDGDTCTLGDQCTSGACEGTPLDCSALDSVCASGTCQEGSCVEVALPCAVTSVRLHVPGGASVRPSGGANSIGYCGSFGHGQAVGAATNINGWSVELGFVPGVVTP